MQTTRLSSKGQVIIPQEVRRRKRWKPGQELEVIDTEEGVVLRPRNPFPESRFEDVGQTLRYNGPRISVDRLGTSALTYREPYERAAADDRD